MDWNEENIERYSRQVVMPQVGVKGQEALCAARFGLPGDAPWGDMADLLERAGMAWERREGHWLNVAGLPLFLRAEATPQGDGLAFFMEEQPQFCTQEPPGHPLLQDPAIAPCLATWWCGLALGLPGVRRSLRFSPLGAGY